MSPSDVKASPQVRIRSVKGPVANARDVERHPPDLRLEALHLLHRRSLEHAEEGSALDAAADPGLRKCHLPRTEAHRVPLLQRRSGVQRVEPLRQGAARRAVACEGERRVGPVEEGVPRVVASAPGAGQVPAQVAPEKTLHAPGGIAQCRLQPRDALLGHAFPQPNHRDLSHHGLVRRRSGAVADRQGG